MKTYEVEVIVSEVDVIDGEACFFYYTLPDTQDIDEFLEDCYEVIIDENGNYLTDICVGDNPYTYGIMKGGC